MESPTPWPIIITALIALVVILGLCVGAVGYAIYLLRRRKLTPPPTFDPPTSDGDWGGPRAPQ